MINDINPGTGIIYKIIAVFGSPRRGGNTDILAERFLEGVDNISKNNSFKVEVEKFFLNNLDISPCRECGNCSRTGECIINDDMQKIYPLVAGCDLLLIASPIFFTTVSGYLKAFIDRFQRFWALKYELKKNIIVNKNKKGIFISAAGSGREDIFDCAKKVVRSLFDVLNIKYYENFLFNKTDKKGDILINKNALGRLYDFGKKGEFLKNGD